MARNSGHNTNSPIPTLLDSAIPSDDSAYRQSKGCPRDDRPVSGHTTRTTEKNDNGSASEGRSSGNESSEDGNEGDVGESDEDGDVDDDEAGDVLAPSDGITNEYGHQAGLTGVENVDEKTIHKDGSGQNYTDHEDDGNDASSLQRIAAAAIDNEDSGDEMYDAVDEVSASEDEHDIAGLDEKDNFRSGKSKDPVLISKRNSRAGSATSAEWEGFALLDPMTDIEYFSDQVGRTEPSILSSEIELFRRTSVYEGTRSMELLRMRSSSPRPRHVHFNEPLMPPSDSDVPTDDEEVYQLFNMDTRPQLELQETFAIDGLEAEHANSSGYETDYSETTDKEDVPPSATTRPQNLLRRPSISSIDFGPPVTTLGGPPAFVKPSKLLASQSKPRPPPALGTFTIHRTKPSFMVDCGANIVEIERRVPVMVNGIPSNGISTSNSTALTSPVNTRLTLGGVSNDATNTIAPSSQVAADPMLSAGSESMANILLPLNQSNNDQVLDSDFFPAEEFYAHVDGFADNDDDHDDDADAENFIFNMINFGDDSSDDNVDASLPTPMSTSPTVVSAIPQSRTPSLDHSAAEELRAHLDKNLVPIGAFRQSQHIDQRQSHQSHHELSAFKSGRQTAGNSSLISPKKRKSSGGFAGNDTYRSSPKRLRGTHL